MALLSQSPITDIIDVNGYCKNVNEPTCQLQFVTTTLFNQTLAISRAEFFDSVSSVYPGGGCTRNVDGYDVAFSPSGYASCIFIKLPNASISPTELYSDVFFPGLSYYYFPTEFVPDFSCNDPFNVSHCTGTLRIPALIQSITLEVTTPILSVNCGTVAIVQPSSSNPVDTFVTPSSQIPINNDNDGNIITYSYIFVVQDPSVLFIDCAMTLMKIDVKYTPYFTITKDDHVIYENLEILTKNLNISQQPDCSQIDSSLCTLHYTTPYFADKPQIQAFIDNSLGFYNVPVYSDEDSVVGSYSVYTQMLFKRVFGNPDSPTPLNNNVISNFQPTGRYLSDRQYPIDLSTMIYYKIVDLNIDETYCTDPQIPFCRVYVQAQYYGPHLAIKFDRLPLSGVLDSVLCNDHQISLDLGGFNPIIRFHTSSATPLSIVIPTQPPMTGSQSTANTILQCRFDFALQYGKVYTSDSIEIQPISSIQTQDYQKRAKNTWTDDLVQYNLFSSPNQVQFSMLPFIPQFATNCMNATSPLCSITFTLPYATLVNKIESTYVRSFGFKIDGFAHFPAADDVNPIFADITGTSYVSVSASAIAADPSDVDTRNTILFNVVTQIEQLNNAKAFDPNGRFPYFDQENTDVVLTLTYAIIPGFTMISSQVPQLVKYNGVSLETPVALDVGADSSTFPTYIPAFLLQYGDDCSSITNAFCTVLLTPTTAATTPATTVTFSILTAAAIDVAIKRMVSSFVSCTPHTSADGMNDSLTFTCDTATTITNASVLTISLIKRLISIPTVHTFELLSYNTTPEKTPSAEQFFQDYELTQSFQYQGDAYPTYSSDCSVANAPECRFTFQIFTAPLYPETIILQYTTPYSNSFTTYEIESCTGGTGIDDATLQTYFSYDIDSTSGIATLSTNDSYTAPIEFTLPIQCIIAHSKKLQNGYLPLRSMPIQIMGVSFDSDYPDFPITSSLSVRLPFTIITYHPTVVSFGDDCKVIHLASVTCTTYLAVYGSPLFPIQDISGQFGLDFSNVHRVIGFTITTLAPYEMAMAYFPVGVYTELTEVASPTYKLYIFHEGNGIGHFKSVYFLTTQTNDSTTLSNAGQYEFVFHLEPTKADVPFSFFVQIDPAYQNITFTTSFVLDIPVFPPEFVTAANLNSFAIEGPSRNYPSIINGVTTSAEKSAWVISPAAMGNPLSLTFPGASQHVAGGTVIPITYTFHNNISSMFLETTLATTETSIDCLSTDDLPSSGITTGQVIGTFLYDKDIKMTKFTPNNINLTAVSCTFPLTVTNAYPTSWFQIKHHLFFIEGPNYDFYVSQSLPQFVVTATIDHISPKSDSSASLSATLSITLILILSLLFFLPV